MYSTDSLLCIVPGPRKAAACAKGRLQCLAQAHPPKRQMLLSLYCAVVQRLRECWSLWNLCEVWSEHVLPVSRSRQTHKPLLQWYPLHNTTCIHKQGAQKTKCKHCTLCKLQHRMQHDVPLHQALLACTHAAAKTEGDIWPVAICSTNRCSRSGSLQAWDGKSWPLGCCCINYRLPPNCLLA